MFFDTAGAATVFSFGAEADHTTDPAYFAPCLGIPDFQFNNLYDVANDLPDSESGLSYNYQTGALEPYQYAFATNLFGMFAEDAWKATRKLTINYGLRYDNYGNPYPITAHGPVVTHTLLTVLQPPSTGSFQQQMANAALVPSGHSFVHDLNWNFSPRAGFGYDPRGDGKWAVRGGFGVYHDWFNIGNATNQSSTNLPNDYSPTFIRGVTSTQPLFSVGTQGDNKYPFGYTYPSISGTALDAHGGIPGSYTGIGGVKRNLSSPTTLNWSAGVEHELSATMTALVEYAGSHSFDQIFGGQSQGLDKVGTDVNVFDGDTIAHPLFNSNGTWNKSVQTRLNTSFGSILYAFNGARANYDAITTGVRGRFGTRGFMSVSYTYGNARDDWSPLQNAYQPDGSWNANRQYGPSALNVTHRLSAAGSYQLPSLHQLNGGLQRLLSGYELSTIVRLQSGQPFTIVDFNPLNLIDTVPGSQLTSSNYSTELAAGHVTYISMANYNSPNVQAALASGSLANSGISGDFSGDGNNNSTPDALSYHQVRKRSVYKYKCPVSQSGCAGSFLASEFATPAFNSAGTEGNQKFEQFRNPGFGDVDLSLIKNTAIWREINLQFRLDLFNAFNRVNWGGLDSNLADFSTTFGTTQSVGSARVGQLGVRLTF